MTRADYAILLEHNEAGWRYAEDAKLDDAMVEYHKIQREGGHLNSLVDSNLAMLLLYCHKFTELEQVAQRIKSEFGRSLFIAAVAAQKSPAVAEQKSLQSGEAADTRRTALLLAAEYLYNTRLYEEGSSLCLKGIQGTPNESAMLLKIAKTPQLRRFEDVECRKGNPRRLVQHLFQAVLLGGARQRESSRLFLNGTTEQDRKMVIEQTRNDWRLVAKMVRKKQYSTQRTVDIILGRSNQFRR